MGESIGSGVSLGVDDAELGDEIGLVGEGSKGIDGRGDGVGEVAGWIVVGDIGTGPDPVDVFIAGVVEDWVEPVCGCLFFGVQIGEVHVGGMGVHEPGDILDALFVEDVDDMAVEVSHAFGAIGEGGVAVEGEQVVVGGVEYVLVGVWAEGDEADGVELGCGREHDGLCEGFNFVGDGSDVLVVYPREDIVESNGGGEVSGPVVWFFGEVSDGVPGDGEDGSVFGDVFGELERGECFALHGVVHGLELGRQVEVGFVPVVECEDDSGVVAIGVVGEVVVVLCDGADAVEPGVDLVRVGYDLGGADDRGCGHCWRGRVDGLGDRVVGGEASEHECGRDEGFWCCHG